MRALSPAIVPHSGLAPAGELAYSTGLLIVAALDILATWYLLRSKLRQKAVEYREWRLQESRRRTTERLMRSVR